MTQENRSTISQYSYRDVLHTRGNIGHIDKMAQLARELGYPYFLWNDRLFKVSDDEVIDTGYTVANVL